MKSTKLKTKQEKGITLIALIITIVVLLILAATAISSITNDGVLQYAQNATGKYNQAVKNEQDMLDHYLSYLQGERWTTIFEGTATTDENGQAILGETNLFAYGEAGAKYKIAVQSAEYEGTVETVPILISNEEGTKIYILFAIDNGQAIGFTSLEDAENKIANLGENAIAVAGIVAEGMCGIMLEGATSEITITKIERTEIAGKKIFEGELELKVNGITEIPNLEEPIISLTKNYIMVISVDGVTYQAINTIDRREYAVYSSWAFYVPVIQVFCNERTIEVLSAGSYNEILCLEIIDLGDNPDIVLENGCVALKDPYSRIMGSC